MFTHSRNLTNRYCPFVDLHGNSNHSHGQLFQRMFWAQPNVAGLFIVFFCNMDIPKVAHVPSHYTPVT